ncbi:DUF885 family protein [Sphingoaurantiacus capsulatus]|uniref:DUF885 family protein n=1 Tax=Sphingoaurantiacus capsulatus TaxID=1771310 RepID=A0ABV7XA76_9SPHN
MTNRAWRASAVASLKAGCVALALLAGSPALAAEPNGRGTHADLLALFADFQAWQATQSDVTRTDFRAGAVAKRRADLSALQARMADMGVARWSPPQKVDYLVTRAELDKAEFILRITRPWARDPGFYVSQLQRPAFTTLPVSGAALDKLRGQIRGIPATLAQARETLTDVAADHADLAIASLTTSDGIEDGYPARKVAPPGVIGWYRDLRERAVPQQPDLVGEIDIALRELDSFRGWLVANRGKMTGRAGVGKDALDWYIGNVLLIPYTSDDIETIGQRELERYRGFYAIERHRNRKLPEIAMAKDGDEYVKRVADTDARIRKWMTDDQIITIPPYIPADWAKHVVPPLYQTPFNVPWTVRRTPPNYWEQIQFRDPSPDHLHAVIPGHRFSFRVSKEASNLIRRSVRSDARWSGWGFYLEEMAVQSGLFDDRPRVRELIQLFGLWRSARSIGDVWNQRNEMTSAEVVDYWMTTTPLMDANVAQAYAHLRTVPGHGMEYTIGNVQMWELLAARKQQLGDKFVLKDFHDEIIVKGLLPLSLIRYEMTGDDTDVKAFFDRKPMPAS